MKNDVAVTDMFSPWNLLQELSSFEANGSISTVNKLNNMSIYLYFADRLCSWCMSHKPRLHVLNRFKLERFEAVQIAFTHRALIQLM